MGLGEGGGGRGGGGLEEGEDRKHAVMIYSEEISFCDDAEETVERQGALMFSGWTGLMKVEWMLGLGMMGCQRAQCSVSGRGVSCPSNGTLKS